MMAERKKDEAMQTRSIISARYEKLKQDQAVWEALEKEKKQLAKTLAHLTQLKSVLKGERFVEFLAQEQLGYIAAQASERLKWLTRSRYALEVAEDGGFIMRDDANGGVRRPVTSLSGGETFLVSLALALSLSGQIQLRGKYPLEFFFLDEGFGTLDEELLDVVMTTLEKLQLENMTIGVISHVAELKQRLNRRLIVEPPEPAGRGTRVRMEKL
jgi:exonuclease SbcC